MKKILYVLGIVFFVVQPVSAENSTYYVSPFGGNGNAGTLNSPWRSINTSVAKLGVGDTLYVRGGTYVEVININVSGTAESPIKIAAYPGELPVIDGQKKIPTNDWAALVSIGGNYINMSGFEVKNSSAYYSRGVNISGAHNIVSKFNVHHIQDNGMLIQGDYNIIEDSKVWQTCYNNVNNQRNGWASGLSAARGNSKTIIPNITSYAILRRNTVFNNWGEGLSCYEADHCIMEDNIVYDNWTVNLYLSDATNSLVQRNMVYISSAPAIKIIGGGGQYSGITMADERASVHRSTNNTIKNNFIYNADLCAFCWAVTPSGLNKGLIANNTIVDGRLLTGEGGVDAIVNTNSKIINNIIISNGNYNSVKRYPGITFSYNNWSVTPAAASSSTDIIADPQIARTGPTTPGDLSPDYFKLLSSSPLIGVGVVVPQVTDDFFKNLRSRTSTDIGAYAIQAPGVASAVSASGSVTNIAPLATVAASSENTVTNQEAIKAIDGVIDGCCNGSYSKEWATTAEKENAWFELNFDKTYTVNQVVLYDRLNTNDQITSATLTFSDGSEVTVGPLINAGSGVVVDFTPVHTTMVRITVNSVSDSTVNVGLSELEVFGF